MPSRTWKSLDSCDEPSVHDAGSGAPPAASAADAASRRDFLRLAGFGVAGAMAASCGRAPVRHAIPFVAQPDGVVPGRAIWYATTCGGCTAGCGLLVKARDGRPIKIEGCPDHPLSSGAVCAVGQGTLLGLYDSLRYRRPQLRGTPSAWADVDTAIGAQLEAIRRDGGAVRVLTTTVHSPTARRRIARFLATFRDGAHVEYDALSVSAVLDAHAATHGARLLPRYRFERADVVVSFDADFLGTWISPGEFAAGYATRRRPEAGPLAWHAQVESRLSMTGGKADRRVALRPGEIDALVFDLAAIVEGRAAGEGLAAELAARLRAAAGRGLVVCGRQDLATQILCNRINLALGNYGATLDVERPSNQRRGNDRAVAALVDEVRANRVAALFVWRANPVFDLPGGEVLGRVPLVVSFAERPDETSAAAHVVCPDHHPLESWADAEPVSGLAGLTQPLVRPLGGTRAFVESLAAWSGEPASAREQVRETWRTSIFPRQSAEADADRFWDRSVQAGYAVVEPASAPVRPTPAVFEAVRPQADPAGLDLVLYHKLALLAGEHAYNPMLQELPDPVSKVVWDNYACLGPPLAARLGVATGDVVRVEAGGEAIEIAALVQPGQADGVVAIALGYGGRITERFKDFGHHWFQSRPTVGENGRVGVSATRFLRITAGLLRGDASGVTVTPTGRTHVLAVTQDHNTLTVPPRLAPAGGERRPIVQEVTPAELAGPRAEAPEAPADLWSIDHPAAGHRWGMVVDLNACTGCSACVVACQVENNIPVVGRDEVRRNREMHWLRLDRYYSEDDQGTHVAWQPMLCQQCEHAPCETVCPTLATVHSAEGLNQQVYNRCVGTRYCLNNCPYKTRRFNWFAYARDPGSERLMLNPDVTVRSRGVMEKCTFCVQRIQEGKIEALRRGEPLKDGDVQTACQQSCPAQAIAFGDLNDPQSRVARLARGARGYKVLEELNVRPSVTYLKLVRQSETAAHDGSAHHG